MSETFPATFVNFANPTPLHVTKQHEKLYKYLESILLRKKLPEFNITDARNQLNSGLGRTKESFIADGGQYVYSFISSVDDYKKNKIMNSTIVVNDQLSLGMDVNIEKFDKFNKIKGLPNFLDNQYLGFGIKASKFAKTQKTIVAVGMPAYKTLRNGKIYNTSGAQFTIANVSDPTGNSKRTIKAHVAVAKVWFNGNPCVAILGYGTSASDPYQSDVALQVPGAK
jgi:hypothetical protein